MPFTGKPQEVASTIVVQGLAGEAASSIGGGDPAPGVACQYHPLPGEMSREAPLRHIDRAQSMLRKCANTCKFVVQYLCQMIGGSASQGVIRDDLALSERHNISFKLIKSCIRSLIHAIDVVA